LLNGKVNKVAGKGLSTNDYTTAEKNKLNGIEAGAQKNPNLSDYAKKTDLDPITRDIKSLEYTQKAFLDGSTKVAYAQGLYHALSGAEVSGVDILDGIDAKRDKTDNMAAADSNTFSEWEFSSDDATVLNAMKLNGAKLVYKESDGRRCWVFENCPSRIGDRYDLVFSDTPETSEEALYISHTLYMDQTLQGYVEVTAQRTVVVTTKTGEPYVTPTGVKNIAIPKYEFVDATITDGVVTVAPYTNAKLVSDGTAFSVVIGGENGYTRDCVLRVECGDAVPTITWGANFHPRTDAEMDFACEAGKRNVYWISEYAPNEFVVAGWQETDGGGTSGGGSAA
jgi:hypothetical protein